MNFYKNHNHRELIAVIEKRDMLTHEALLKLRVALKKAGLEESLVVLNKTIEEKELQIFNLESLRDLGFTAVHDIDNRTLEIKRVFLAKVFDIVSFVLGLVLSFLGLVFMWLLLAMFAGYNEFSLGSLFIYILMISLGLIGFKMLSSISRFLAYHNFNFLQEGDRITLRKDGISGSRTFSSNQVHISEEEDDIILSIDAIELIRAGKGNVVHTLTIQELIHKIEANS
ncbi:MAG: hypothetical protein ACI849_000153 [Patiriisocius sp.]|jgi:hypothetical protein